MTFISNLRTVLRSINNHPLAGRHKVKAFRKFFGWQISQMLFPGFRKVGFTANTFLIANKGMTGATGNIYCGLHEFSEMSFLLHFLKNGDTFFDVGANIGSYTVLAAGHCGANTFSFEPVPETFKFLQQNIKANAIGHLVKPYMAAVGAQAGMMRFTNNLDTVNHALSKDEEWSREFTNVPVVYLDAVSQENNAYPCLIKIDVEGFETEVIKGMGSLLENPVLQAIIIELNGSWGRYGFDENKIHEQITENGFLPYAYDPFKRTLNQLEEHTAFNTIYVRDVPEVMKRLLSASPVKIFNESF